MEVQAARGGERMLRRVIAQLFALAALAERAAGRSLPVRWFVLWILRRAEIVAEGFVFDEAAMPPPAREGIAPQGSGPEDALRLAKRFRALAAALCALLPTDCRLARRGFALAQMSATFCHGLTCWTRKPHDTS